MLAIGVVFIAAITLVVFLSTLIDGGKLNEFRAGYPTMTDAQVIAALSDPQLQLGTAFSALLSLWVEIATWWAVALVVFQEATAAGAMATTLRAARANLKPLALYCVGVFFYGGVVPTIIIVLVALVAPASAAQMLATVLIVPYWIFFAGHAARLLLRELSRRVPCRRDAGAAHGRRVRRRKDRDAHPHAARPRAPFLHAGCRESRSSLTIRAPHCAAISPAQYRFAS